MAVSTPSQGKTADGAIEFPKSLIKKGDKDLLKTVLEVAPWSDGTPAESVETIFADELHESPDTFLDQLRGCSKKVRNGFYQCQARVDRLELCHERTAYDDPWNW